MASTATGSRRDAEPTATPNSGSNGAMSAGHTVTITEIDSHVEVRLGTEVLAKSDRAPRLDETGLPPRYYVPKEERPHGPVAADDVRDHDARSRASLSYWSATVDGETHDGIVWAYETPIEAAAEIAGYLSFYPHRAEVTVDGEPLAG